MGTLRPPVALLLTIDPNEKNHVSELLNNNHTVLTHARDLPDMRSRLQDHRPDLLLCDWPYYADCWREVCEAVEKHAPGLPVIVLSRNGGEREWVDALASGAFDLLTWPSPQSTILAAVEHAKASYEARMLFAVLNAVDDIPMAG
jgi:two-component system OmpR family response regulator